MSHPQVGENRMERFSLLQGCFGVWEVREEEGEEEEWEEEEVEGTGVGNLLNEKRR